MALEDELRSWIKGLAPSEKRFVSLIGHARAKSGSQLLELFEWLKKSKEGEEIPVKASFRNNLPTLVVRLRELILDSLRLLHKENDVDATLRTLLDETSILQNKKLWPAAGRHLRKAKKLAYETSRYTSVLHCINMELLQAKQFPPNQVSAALSELRKEEQSVIAKHQALSELRFRHDSILALAKQYSFSQTPKIIEQAKNLVNASLVLEQIHSESYLENALAVDILGMLDLFLRETEPAVERYRNLLNTWRTKTEWQMDQSDLLILICKNYQNVCFYSTVNPGLVHSNLMSLKGFEGLPPDKLRSFRETLFHHHFILNLNAGELDAVLEIIPEIENWMKTESAHLIETQVLPFLCNFMIAEFLSEHFVEANKYLQRILNLPDKKARVDIREFALVLQPVIHYELGNTALNEYLTRSGKRHFRKNEESIGFELTVLKNLESLANTNDKKEQKKILQQFADELKKLTSHQTGSVPLLGLNEISMWCASRKNNVSLSEVFLEEVKKAHAAADVHVFN